MAFLEVRDVIKLYKPDNELLQIPALRGVDLSLNESELTTIIGPSGAGKSTLIKLIGGMELPSSGIVEMKGVGQINKLKIKELENYRKNKVGFVYQFPEKNLIPSLSAEENVILPMRIKGGLTREFRINRAHELLKALGVFNRRENTLKALSGGEAQRVSIAVALANSPPLILADEPTGELDSENTFKIIDYFQEINKNYGTSFIVVTHDERFAKMTKKTYKIKDGRIYGFHRRVIDGSSQDSLLKREHLLLVDRHGNLRLPEELIKKANIREQVVVRYDELKGILEVIAMND
ncbi:MAG: ABC transporter ATP-binding protein [Promethearchaeota archaeon]|jgi:ABC-type lipoprotein export system ATPase subunit